jgi:predicted transglutaminase-like cysteine proteinase
MAVASVALSALATGLTSGGVRARAEAKLGIFGYLETKREGLEAFPKWTGALERYFEEKAHTVGNCAAKEFNRCHYDTWTAFLDGIKNETPERKLKKVNDFMNKARYILDPINWGVKDYWATPGQFFEKYGDCEDYAIAKYLLLRGAEPATGPFLIVATARGRPHAMCGIAVPGGYAVLDNLRPAIAVVRHLNAVAPIYLLDEQALYLPPPDARRLADRRH